MTTVSAVHPAAFPWYDPGGFTFSMALRVGGEVWCSGHSGSAFDPGKGRPDVSGGMGEQARTAYAKQSAVLAGAGLGPLDVTAVVENVALAGLPCYAEAEAARRAFLGPNVPVVTTVVVDRLVRAKALIEVEVHAAPGGRPGGDVVALPMLLPTRPDGTTVGAGDPAAQYAACLEDGERRLKALGLGLDDVVSLVEYTTGPGMPDGATRLAPSASTRLRAAGLHRPDVLVSLRLMASRRPGALTHLAASARQGTLREQAEAVYGALTGAGRLVSTVEYVAESALRDYRAVADVRRALLREPYPVSTGVVCREMTHPGCLLAVAAVAVAEGR